LRRGRSFSCSIGSVSTLFVVLVSVAAVAAEPACPTYAEHPVRTGATPRALSELSGLAASARHAGVYWAHNDGSKTSLFAVRADGKVLATFALGSPLPRDLEAIALGPCTAGASERCLFLGDIGDNSQRRDRVQILKLPEPAHLDGAPLSAEVLPFTYPDGPRNAEALVAEPGSGRLFVITKGLTSLGEVYRLDDLGAPGGGKAVRIITLRPTAEFDFYTTAADAHPSGERVLLRTYGRVWEFRRPGARRLEEVFAAPPIAVTGAPNLQGEAIAYSADGRGYVLGGEGAGSALFRVECAKKK
jgi:hypothetical protein